MGKKVKEISGDFNADSIIEESRNILNTPPAICKEPELSDKPKTDDGQPPEQESVPEPERLPEPEVVQQKREPTVDNKHSVKINYPLYADKSNSVSETFFEILEV
jgi:hypothetical protein